MRIRMLKLAAGPAGVRVAGAEYDLPEPEARSLIASGAADQVGTDPAPAPETADATNPGAEQRPAHGGRGGRQRNQREAKPTDDADHRDGANR